MNHRSTFYRYKKFFQNFASQSDFFIHLEKEKCTPIMTPQNGFYPIQKLQMENITKRAENHLPALWISLVVFCTLLGLFCGYILAISDDAPGAIFIFGGIAFIGSSIIASIGLGGTKLLLDMKKKLEK